MQGRPTLDLLDAVHPEPLRFALPRLHRDAPVQAQVLGEVAQSIQVGPGVATHPEEVHGRCHALPVHQIPVGPQHLVHEGRMHRVVRHPMVQFHAQVEDRSSLQQSGQRI